MESNGNDYIWNGDFLGETFTSIGLECYAIQPTLKEVDGQIQGSSNVVQGPSKSNPENSMKHLVSCCV